MAKRCEVNTKLKEAQTSPEIYSGRVRARSFLLETENQSARREISKNLRKIKVDLFMDQFKLGEGMK